MTKRTAKRTTAVSLEDLEHKLNLILTRLDRLEARISKISPEEGITQGMTQVEVARFLGVSVNYFKQHVRHQIPHKQADRKIIFSRSDVLNWLHGHKNDTAGRRKVLIVDDEESSRKILRVQLQEEGYLTTEAEDGEQGIKVYRREKPDLVVLDLFMPNVDGLGFVRELLNEDKEARFVAISGGMEGQMNADAILKSAKTLGAIEVFHKPLDLERFMTTVKTTLR